MSVKIDFELAFRNAGAFTIPNPQMQIYALRILTSICIASIKGEDWDPSPSDREFAQTEQFQALRKRFTQEVFQQISAARKKQEPEPLEAIDMSKAPWWEVD